MRHGGTGNEVWKQGRHSCCRVWSSLCKEVRLEDQLCLRGRIMQKNLLTQRAALEFQEQSLAPVLSQTPIVPFFHGPQHSQIWFQYILELLSYKSNGIQTFRGWQPLANVRLPPCPPTSQSCGFPICSLRKYPKNKVLGRCMCPWKLCQCISGSQYLASRLTWLLQHMGPQS